jgi:formylglycine-generating enzyme required for sulfatase activity
VRPIGLIVSVFFLLAAGSVRAAPGLYVPNLTPIPGGSFRMGSLDGNRDERPIRTVEVKAFSMGRTEVTIGEYLRCMADSACTIPTWWGSGYFEEVSDHLTPAERMRLPITGVSWRQAKAYCRWLGPGYDLPTEAEWEYAAGAGKGWIYPWGNEAGERFRDSRKERRLPPVATFKPSPLNLYDLAGGVWEWVDDCYKAGKNGACLQRTAKGGSWSEHLWNLRVANRSFGLEDEGYKQLGFRVVYRAP